MASLWRVKFAQTIVTLGLYPPHFALFCPTKTGKLINPLIALAFATTRVIVICYLVSLPISENNWCYLLNQADQSALSCVEDSHHDLYVKRAPGCRPATTTTKTTTKETTTTPKTTAISSTSQSSGSVCNGNGSSYGKLCNCNPGYIGPFCEVVDPCWNFVTNKRVDCGPVDLG